MKPVEYPSTTGVGLWGLPFRAIGGRKKTCYHIWNILVLEVRDIWPDSPWLFPLIGWHLLHSPSWQGDGCCGLVILEDLPVTYSLHKGSVPIFTTDIFHQEFQRLVLNLSCSVPFEFFGKYAAGHPISSCSIATLVAAPIGQQVQWHIDIFGEVPTFLEQHPWPHQWN